jgi:hypothetical protein
VRAPARQRAQDGGLARAGVAEQGADAALRQIEVDVEQEIAAVEADACADSRHQRCPFMAFGLKV